MRVTLVRGLTLLELMVTLMIVSMALALLGQLMHQMSQVERRLEEDAQAESVHWAPRMALRSLLESVLPEMISLPDTFVGNERQLYFSSADTLAFSGAAQGRMSLRFEGSDRPDGEQRLSLQAVGRVAEGADAAPSVLLRWQGEPGRIEYLDEKGNWQQRWPNDPEALRRPPRLLRLILPKSQGGTMWLAVGVSTGPRASLGHWAKQ